MRPRTKQRPRTCGQGDAATSTERRVRGHHVHVVELKPLLGLVRSVDASGAGSLRSGFVADRVVGLRRSCLIASGSVAGVENLRGVAVLEVGADEVVCAVGGTTGADPDRECDAGTRFQVASVSKQFTAAAILLLVDRQVLGLNDQIDAWLVGCPPSWSGITIHHLLTHTAGLGHWWQVPGLDLTAAISANDELSMFKATPVVGKPGDRFAYSSPGYVLAARIVERAARQPYAAFLDDEIFGPVGMSSTFAGNPGPQSNLAYGHRDGKPTRSFELHTVNAGAGDVWSTAGDLLRWDRAVASGAVLSAASRHLMFTNHVLVRDQGASTVIRPEGYGYGWFLGRVDVPGHRALFHPGDNAGFVALNAWLPDDDIQLVVLSNEESTDLGPVVRAMLQMAINGW